MKDKNDLIRKDLLILPHRDWQVDTVYDSLLIFSTRQKHDSGYARMYIIGMDDDTPKEIATSGSDDIEWKVPIGVHGIGQLRTDCLAKSGILHFWSNYCKFKVGLACSSITVEMVPKEESNK